MIFLFFFIFFLKERIWLLSFCPDFCGCENMILSIFWSVMQKIFNIYKLASNHEKAYNGSKSNVWNWNKNWIRRNICVILTKKFMSLHYIDFFKCTQSLYETYLFLHISTFHRKTERTKWAIFKETEISREKNLYSPYSNTYVCIFYPS